MKEEFDEVSYIQDKMSEDLVPVLKQLEKNQDEQAEVAKLLAEWYLEWKVKFPKVPHPFGYATEALKTQLCLWISKQNFER